MIESTKSAHPDDVSTLSSPSAVSAVSAVSAGQERGPSTPSVRELLAELAQLEDATRGLGGARRPRWTVQSTDLRAALAREQEIIDELHRRCPDARRGGSVSEDAGTAGRPD